MRKLLKALYIVQEKTTLDKFKRRTKVQRLNPYNPLTYIAILIASIIGMILFGIVGYWNMIELKQSFKYQ